jgi:transposase
MASNNNKYTEEIREQTARHIIENNISATSVGEEMGIDKNTICRWVREYRRQNKMPSYREEKGIVPKSTTPVDKEFAQKIKDLERQVKAKEKALQEEKEKVEILKKSLHIFMQPHG